MWAQNQGSVFLMAFIHLISRLTEITEYNSYEKIPKRK